MKMFQLANDLHNKMFNSGLFPACSMCCVDLAPSGFHGSNCAAVILPFRSFLAKVSWGSFPWIWRADLPRARATLCVSYAMDVEFGRFRWPNLTDWVPWDLLEELCHVSSLARLDHCSSRSFLLACRFCVLGWFCGMQDDERSSARSEPEICQDQLICLGQFN